MTSYARRHASMGVLAMFALVVAGVAWHAPPSYYVLLATVGVLRAAVVRAFRRRLRKHGK